MRITRDTLLKNVRDTVARRTRQDRGLISVFLCGSLLGEDFLLGGSTDIDLVFIHGDAPEVDREIAPLNEDIHLDISHHLHRDYRQPRKVRVHPWMGPTVYECEIFFDPQHFMDFTQASVRGQFFQPEHVMQRAQVQAEHARQMWTEQYTTQPEATPDVLRKYLRALEHAANAVASLQGAPLTERRFLSEFPRRAAAAGSPGLYPGLLGLLGAPNTNPDQIRSWIPLWKAAFQALPKAVAPRKLHPARLRYYQAGFTSGLKSQDPLVVLWPLIRTWTEMIGCFPEGSEHNLAWQAAMEQLQVGGEGFRERITALDSYLDLVEETLERWGAANGVQE